MIQGRVVGTCAGAVRHPILRVHLILYVLCSLFALVAARGDGGGGRCVILSDDRCFFMGVVFDIDSQH